MNVDQVTGDADADQLAGAGAVLLTAGGEAREQQVGKVEPLARPDDDLVAGIMALAPAGVPQRQLVLPTQRLPATQLGDETVHRYAKPLFLFCPKSVRAAS